MRLIDVDKLLDILDVMIVGHKSASDVYDVVDSVPTIDAESLIAKHEDIGYEKGFRDGYAEALEATDNAKSVKRGHWTIEDIVTYERSYGGTLYEPVYKCSCCGRVTESYVRGDEPIMPEDADFPEFCGNCGAKMDEVEDETD